MQDFVTIDHTKHFIGLTICIVPAMAYTIFDLFQAYSIDPLDLLLIDAIQVLNALQLLIAASFLFVRFCSFNRYLKTKSPDLKTSLWIFQQLLSTIKDVNATFGFQTMIFVIFLVTSGIAAIFSCVESFFGDLKELRGIAIIAIYVTSYHHVALFVFCVVNSLMEMEVGLLKNYLILMCKSF